MHTRRTIVEKTLETTLDILTKSERPRHEQDEISEAVKEDNEQDIKFGASVTASYASIEATSQLRLRDLAEDGARNHPQAHAPADREALFRDPQELQVHVQDRRPRRPTSRAPSTCWPTPRNELINYELRRKMRQVGVQVQDIGTFLCWQTYVDDPGRAARPGQAHPHRQARRTGRHSASRGNPAAAAVPGRARWSRFRSSPWTDTDADNEGEVYVDGVEVDNSEFLGSLEKIQADFPQEFVCPKADYELTNVEFDPQGKPVTRVAQGRHHERRRRRRPSRCIWTRRTFRARTASRSS